MSISSIDVGQKYNPYCADKISTQNKKTIKNNKKMQSLAFSVGAGNIFSKKVLPSIDFKNVFSQPKIFAGIGLNQRGEIQKGAQGTKKSFANFLWHEKKYDCRFWKFCGNQTNYISRIQT